MGQEGVLLGLVEPVYLVDEQDGGPAGAAGGLCARHRLPDVLDAAQHRRDGEELRVEGLGHQAREGGLPGTGRAPEDHRVRAPCLEGDAQRLARAEQVFLPDDFVQAARAHALGQRRADRRGRRGCVASGRSGGGRAARAFEQIRLLLVGTHRCGRCWLRARTGHFTQAAGAGARRAVARPMFSALAIIRPRKRAIPAQISAGWPVSISTPNTAGASAAPTSRPE